MIKLKHDPSDDPFHGYRPECAVEACGCCPAQYHMRVGDRRIRFDGHRGNARRLRDLSERCGVKSGWLWPGRLGFLGTWSEDSHIVVFGYMIRTWNIVRMAPEVIAALLEQERLADIRWWAADHGLIACYSCRQHGLEMCDPECPRSATRATPSHEEPS